MLRNLVLNRTEAVTEMSAMLRFDEQKDRKGRSERPAYEELDIGVE